VPEGMCVKENVLTREIYNKLDCTFLVNKMHINLLLMISIDAWSQITSIYIQKRNDMSVFQGTF